LICTDTNFFKKTKDPDIQKFQIGDL